MNKPRKSVPYWSVPVLIPALMLGFFSRPFVTNTLRQNQPLLQDIWSIGMVHGASPFNLTDTGIKNPVLTASDVTDMDCLFVADPFIVREGESWFMFFEALDRLNNKGRIALAESDDGLKWRYKQLVLKEEHHLSYPYVFKHRGDYYMVPESSEAYGVFLYKAERFPDRWVKTSRLLSGEFVDTSIFRYNGLWWMFTTDLVDKGRNNVLRLFYSPELAGPWQEHAQSPLFHCTMHNSRSGGRVVVIGTSVFRYAQDDHETYGNQLRAFKITALTPQTYQEAELPWPIIQSDQPWHSLGIHHSSPLATPGGRWLASIDGHALKPLNRRK